MPSMVKLKRNGVFPIQSGSRQGRPIGSAIEFVKGEARETPCYGTYREDMADARFRFKIAFVEHGEAFKLHSHEYSELVFVLGGRAIHVTEGENYPLEAGDVFVINGEMRHGFQEPRGLRLCNVMYDPRQFVNGSRDLDRLMGFHALFDLEPRASQEGQAKKKLHLCADDQAHAVSLLTVLKDEYESGADGRQTMIHGAFQLLITFLARKYETQESRSGTPLMRMAQALSHIQKNFREPLRVADLAAIAHLSPSQFQRKFKSVYNTTPVRFINQVRIHEACEMLRDPNRDVTSVAFDAGFSSSSFFATQFRQIMGESPTAYRRNH